MSSALSSSSVSSSQVLLSTISQEHIDQTRKKIQVFTEVLFKEHHDNPKFIERDYKIFLIDFCKKEELEKLIFTFLGFTDVGKDTTGFISSSLDDLLNKFRAFLNNSNAHESRITKQELEPLNGKLSEIAGRLKENPGNNIQLIELYFNIKSIKNLIIKSSLDILKEDLEPTLFSIEIEIMRALHKEHAESSTPEEDINQWNQTLDSVYKTSLSAIQYSFSLDTNADNIPFINTEMPGSNEYGSVKIGFHALPVQFNYLSKFAAKAQKPKGKGIFDFDGFSLKHDNTCNCMSFGVGRKSRKFLTPSGNIVTTREISTLHRQLIETGCINVESINANDLLWLKAFTKKNKLLYLTSFVFGLGGQGGIQPDYHVYRCFFDQRNQRPIWMELAMAKGGIQFSKHPLSKQLIVGIPHNPKEVFCTDPWDTFAGYWLVPPDAIFKMEVPFRSSIVRRADFQLFDSKKTSSEEEKKS